MEFPLKEHRIPAQHQAPKPRVPVLGREVPITSGCENQWELRLSEMEGCWSCRQFLLKGL